MLLFFSGCSGSNSVPSGQNSDSVPSRQNSNSVTLGQNSLADRRQKVESVDLALGISNPIAGKRQLIPLAITLKDGNGNAITGTAPFIHELTLKTSDQKVGALSRTVLRSAADASGITVQYNGANTKGITYLATALGLAPTNVIKAVLVSTNYAYYNGKKYFAGLLPPAFDPLTPLASLGQSKTPNTHYFFDPVGAHRNIGGIAKISRAAKPVTPFSVNTTQDNGGQLGIYIPKTSQVVMTSMTVSHQFQFPADVPLTDPGAGNSDQNVLYAPTSKGFSSDCFENGSNYFKAAGQPTYGLFRVFDFCTTSSSSPVGTFVYSTPLNDTFRANYVVLTSDFDGAQILYYSTSTALMSDGLWHALLYNYPTSSWDDLQVTSSGTPTRQDGWSIFETHYTPGPCAMTPEFRSEQYNFTTATSNGMIQYNNSHYSHPGDCIQNDTSGTGSYNAIFYDPNGYYWSTTSYQS